jgi:lipopolysaccharide transport system permease protein
LWHFRELLLFLAVRDIKVRYKQTLLGAGWAVLMPLLTMVVFNVLFSVLMGRPPSPQGIPYAVSTFCALVPWQLFAHSLTQSGNSLVMNRNMITKVYFPRLIMPVAPTLAALVDFLIAFVVLVGIIAVYHCTRIGQPVADYRFHFTWQLCLLPIFVVLTLITSLAISFWLSALNAIYRDFRYMIPFLVQMWMYLSPVIYATEDSRFQQYFTKYPWLATLYGLNPMAGVLEGFRWVLLGGQPPPLGLLVASVSMVVLLFIGGAFYFRRMERTFIDLV